MPFDTHLTGRLLALLLVLPIGACGDFAGPGEAEPRQVTGPFPYTAFAYGLNDNGLVVGTRRTSPGMVVQGDEIWSHAFVWDPVAEDTTILPLLPGGQDAVAYDINNDEVVVGSVADSTQAGQPFRWTEEGGLELLPLVGAEWSGGRARTVDDAGVIAGVGYSPEGRHIPLIWPGDGSVRAMEAPDATASYSVRDISEAGLLVGVEEFRTDGYHSVAVAWDETGAIRRLGVPDGHDFSASAGVDATGTVLVWAGNLLGGGASFLATAEGYEQAPILSGAINDDGALAGRTASDGEEVVVWVPDSGIETLPNHLGDVEPIAINGRLEVLGSYQVSADLTSAKTHGVFVMLRR